MCDRSGVVVVDERKSIAHLLLLAMLSGFVVLSFLCLSIFHLPFRGYIRAFSVFVLYARKFIPSYAQQTEDGYGLIACLCACVQLRFAKKGADENKKKKKKAQERKKIKIKSPQNRMCERHSSAYTQRTAYMSRTISYLFALLHIIFVLLLCT